MHKVYKAKDRTKYFWIEHWSTLLESARLLGPVTGMCPQIRDLILAKLF
jgi:hypothetical protein